MSSVPKTHTLANGVRVVCDPAPGYGTLALSVVAGRGSREEDPSRNGWSHLLEHMVFKGAGARSARELVEVIESEGGQLNAATGHERTSFQVRALEGGAPLAMEIVSDLLLHPTLDADDLAREKQVIGQEIAEAADTPDDQVFELAQSAAFADQPLGRSILGKPETLAPADPVALDAWRARLYAPDRIVVSAAGAIDEDELLKLAEAGLGGASTLPPSSPPGAAFTGGVATETRRLEQAHLVFLLPGVAVLDPAYWAFRLFAEALGGGMSSRLFQEVRERLGLAYAIDAYAEAWTDVGVLGVYAGCAAGDADALAEAAAGQIRDLLRNPLPQELDRAKAQLKASLYMSRESLASRAEQTAAQILVFGRPVPTVEFAEAIDGVTLEDIAALERVVMTGRVATSVLGPRAAARAPERFGAALVA
ncbi:MAG: insulinase family protein [Caulobacteraceae bacterium]|nr:insulinase family protein [Caulobacteraceae bacterium]